MAFVVEDNGDIKLIQGDSGVFVVNGLSVDNNYKVYFSFYDSKRRVVGEELMVFSNKEPCVSFEIPASLTDKLIVSKNDDSTEYYYGIKACLDERGFEDTLLVEGSEIGDLNTVIVYPKKVEGI